MDKKLEELLRQAKQLNTAKYKQQSETIASDLNRDDTQPGIPQIDTRPERLRTETPKEKACPFCAETIAYAAIKCKHCGEMLSAKPLSQDKKVAWVLASTILGTAVALGVLYWKSYQSKKKADRAAEQIMEGLERIKFGN